MKSISFFLFCTALAGVLASLSCGVGIGMGVVNALIALKFFGGIYLCYSQVTGWGVGLVEGRLIQGLPWGHWVGYLLVIAIAALLAVLGGSLSGDIGDSTSANIISVGRSMSSGAIISILYWIFVMKEQNRLGSEYDARVEYTDKGLSSEAIEAKIKDLRRQGLIA